MFRNFITSKWTISLLFIIGIAMLVLGSHMFLAKDVVYTTTTIPGTQGTYAVRGAIGGGAVGATAGLGIGGVGIAACGTGIGIPVGVVCLALAGICAVVGGSAGAAVGTTSQTVTSAQVIDAFQWWQYSLIWFVGALLFTIAFYAIYLRKQQKAQQN